MLFEFPNTGAVLSIYRFSTLKLLRYVTPTDYFVMALEGVLFLLCLYYTIEEMIEIKNYGLAYFKGVWNCVDIILLMLSYSLLAINLYRTFEVNSTLTMILRSRDYFANFGLITRWQELFNDLVAITLFLAWMKVMNYTLNNVVATSFSALTSLQHPYNVVLTSCPSCRCFRNVLSYHKQKKMDLKRSVTHVNNM